MMKYHRRPANAAGLLSAAIAGDGGVRNCQRAPPRRRRFTLEWPSFTLFHALMLRLRRFDGLDMRKFTARRRNCECGTA